MGEENKFETWGFSALAVTIISVTSLIGIFTIKLLDSKHWVYLSDLLLAIGCSVLFCDSFLHLLPHATGLVTCLSEHDGNKIPMLTKMTGFLGVFLLYWILDVLVKRNRFVKSSFYKSSKLPRQRLATISATTFGEAKSLERMTTVTALTDEGLQTQFQEALGAKLTILLMGDMLHNFIDGLAIASAFSISNNTGLATSIAILCHEVPHELGDFAIYFRITKSWKKSIIFNVSSAAVCYIGLIIGLLVSEKVNQAKEWLIMIAAASFVYITVVPMLPELDVSSTPWGQKFKLRFILVLAGFLIGYAIMFCLGWFEPQLAEAFGIGHGHSHAP